MPVLQAFFRICFVFGDSVDHPVDQGAEVFPTMRAQEAISEFTLKALSFLVFGNGKGTVFFFVI